MLTTLNSEWDCVACVFFQSSYPHCTLVNHIFFGHFAVEV